MTATGPARLSRTEVRRFDWDHSDPVSVLFAQEFLDAPQTTTSPPPVVRHRIGALSSF